MNTQAATATETTNLMERARAIGPVITAERELTEQAGRLTDRALEALVSSGLLRAYVPESLGGLEADPISYMQALEYLAVCDNTAAWQCQVQNGAAATLGMAPAESADWGKNLGTVESSIGLREDGVLSRNARFGMEQGTFSVGDTVRMEYKNGRLRWYHGASKLSLLLAEAEGVPYGWHFGVSGMSAQVKIIEGMPSLTEAEQKVLETRQKVCRALKQ